MAVAKFLEGNWKYKSTEMQKKNGFVIWSLHNSYQWIQNCYFKNQNSKLFESIDIIKLFEFFIFYLFLFFFNFSKKFSSPAHASWNTHNIDSYDIDVTETPYQKYQRKKAKSCELSRCFWIIFNFYSIFSWIFSNIRLFSIFLGPSPALKYVHIK